MSKLSADAAFAALAELARLGASDAPPAALAELAGPILIRATSAPAVRLTVDAGLTKQVLFAAWPDEADTWRSRLSLPMVAGSRVIGLVECAAPQEGAFDSSIRQLVEASALVLARLVGTAASDLTQNVLELRTLQRVAETVSRTLDLEEVLGRCLDLALQVAHAPAGVIYLRDGQRGVYRRVQHRNIPEDGAPLEIPAAAVEPRFSRGESARVIDVDISADETPVLQGARRHGIKRIIMMPLRAEDRLVGVLGLDFFAAATLLPSTLLTLEAIAGQEAIAIENARVHRQAELRARMASTLRQFAERALSTLDQHELYRLMLEASCKLSRGDRALISQIVDNGQTVRVVAGLGKDERLVGMDLPVGAPYVKESFERMPMIVEETASMPPESVFAQVAKENETKSFALFLMRYRDQPIGHVFSGSSELRRYEPAEIEAMQTLAAMSAEVLERARAQKAVENERERLDAIIDHMPIVMAVIDKSGKVSHLNRAGREFSKVFDTADARETDWTTGLSRIRTCTTDGKPVPFEDLQVVRAFRGEHPGPRELLLTGEGGTHRIYVMAVAAPLFGPDGKTVEQVVTAFQDVSTLRELADAKDRFLRVASHELRSPITSLRATTSLLELDPAAVEDPERRAVMLQRIHRQVDRLIKLVEQLLDSARLNAEQVPIQPADAEMGQLVEEAITLAASAPADRARMRIEQPGPVRGKWDPLRIEQVLTNLLTNALRYSPASAPVVVRLTDADPVLVEVIDQGIGIPPNQLDQVFSPFFRGTNAQAQHKGGLGLGLHITAEIVRRHGGKIRVQSELGRGSTFTVELPRHRT